MSNTKSELAKLFRDICYGSFDRSHLQTLRAYASLEDCPFWKNADVFESNQTLFNHVAQATDKEMNHLFYMMGQAHFPQINLINRAFSERGWKYNPQPWTFQGGDYFLGSLSSAQNNEKRIQELENLLAKERSENETKIALLRKKFHDDFTSFSARKNQEIEDLRKEIESLKKGHHEVSESSSFGQSQLLKVPKKVNWNRKMYAEMISSQQNIWDAEDLQKYRDVVMVNYRDNRDLMRGIVNLNKSIDLQSYLTGMYTFLSGKLPDSFSNALDLFKEIVLDPKNGFSNRVTTTMKNYLRSIGETV